MLGFSLASLRANKSKLEKLESNAKPGFIFGFWLLLHFDFCIL